MTPSTSDLLYLNEYFPSDVWYCNSHINVIFKYYGTSMTGEGFQALIVWDNEISKEIMNWRHVAKILHQRGWATLLDQKTPSLLYETAV